VTILAAVLAAALASSAAAQPRASIEIPIDGFAFPQTVVVDVGSTVRWQNVDPAPHIGYTYAYAADNGEQP
jgi:plastocyanin